MSASPDYSVVVPDTSTPTAVIDPAPVAAPTAVERIIRDTERDIDKALTSSLIDFDARMSLALAHFSYGFARLAIELDAQVAEPNRMDIDLYRRVS